MYKIDMASGIPMSSECKHVYDQIQRLKQHRYAVFVIEKNRRIRVEWLGARDAGYEEFLQDLRRAGPAQCRFAVYDYAFHHQIKGTSVTRLREKVFLMLWCPSEALIKDKVLYTSTFGVLKREFNGVQKCIQATELEDINPSKVERELCGDREF